MVYIDGPHIGNDRVGKATIGGVFLKVALDACLAEVQAFEAELKKKLAG